MTEFDSGRRATLTGAAALTGLGGLPVLAAQRRPVRLSLLGQALLENDLRTQVWPDRERVSALVRHGEIGFTNLETVIRSSIVGTATREELTLHAGEPVVIDCLKSLGITLVATSNNHTFDLGQGGVLSTLKALDAAHLPHAGSGIDLDNAAAAGFATTKNGTRVALVGFATGKVRDGGAASPTRPGVNEVREDSPGVLNAQDLARVHAALAEGAKTAEVVIAYQHNHLWGDDMAITAPWQRQLAKRCIDAGATVFVSHGAPLLHGMELYNNAPLFYGLGNFIFQTETPPGTYPQRVWDGLIVDCQISGAGKPRIGFIPIVLNDTGLGGPSDMATRGRPSLAGTVDATRILADFAARSKAFGVTIAIRDGVGLLV